MLPYISWPEFGLNEHEQNCNTTEKSTINYTSTENAVLSLCSMKIAKNHWVTFKCTVIHISLHLLVPSDHSYLGQFDSIFLQLDYRKTNTKLQKTTKTTGIRDLPRMDNF